MIRETVERALITGSVIFLKISLILAVRVVVLGHV